MAIVIAVGSFARTLKTQRLVNHLMSVNSNSSIVLEQIAREMRSGFGFQVRGNAACPAATSQFDEIEFTNDKSNKVYYHLENGAIKREECLRSDCASANFVVLTSPDTAVTRFCFIMNNPTQSPRTDPWRITTVLTIGSVRPDLSTNYINLETTIAARVIPKDLLP